MSAETLRRAAAEMRQDSQGPVILAVADWLDDIAFAREAIDGIARHQDEPPGQGTHFFLTEERRALAVANAYLGETP